MKHGTSLAAILVLIPGCISPPNLFDTKDAVFLGRIYLQKLLQKRMLTG